MTVLDPLLPPPPNNPHCRRTLSTPLLPANPLRNPSTPRQPRLLPPPPPQICSIRPVVPRLPPSSQPPDVPHPGSRCLGPTNAILIGRKGGIQARNEFQRCPGHVPRVICHEPPFFSIFPLTPVLSCFFTLTRKGFVAFAPRNRFFRQCSRTFFLPWRSTVSLGDRFFSPRPHVDRRVHPQWPESPLAATVPD